MDPIDLALRGFLLERRKIMRDLATVLTRVGYNNPKRKQLNAERSKKRKLLRRRLRLNSEAIASRWSELFDLEHPDG